MKNIYSRILRLWWKINQSKHERKDNNKAKFLPTSTSFDNKNYVNQIPITYHKILDKTCTIEPNIGWAIFGRNILAESYAFWPNIAQGWPPLPSLINYLNPFRRLKKIKKAVSFHYGWDNYYHFFIDTLPQIEYWKTQGRKDVVWVVPEKIKTISFVQDYLSLNPIFDGQNIVYHAPNEYIKIVEEAHFIKRSRYGSVELKSCIDRLMNKLLSKDLGDSKKIFLIRKKYRSATNLEELIAIAKKHGFEAQLTDGLSLSDQIYLFANTRWLIGFHGAGLTNMVFRKDQPLSVLELFPENKIPLHYWHLTIDFGFNYSYLIGDAFTSVDENYFIEPDRFNEAIIRMLEEDPSLSL